VFNLNWLYIIPVLGFLVFIHELGHFLTAKRFGIKVTEFGFGFPPRLAGVKFGETIYSINLIPIGGFVKLVGEEDPTDPRSFARQSVLKRAIVLSAGSFMNFVVPVVMFTVLFMLPHEEIVGGSVVISAVAPGSPAQEAGLRPGDTVLQVDAQPIDGTTEFIAKVREKVGLPVELTVRRGAAVSGMRSSPEFALVETVTVVPRANPPTLNIVEEVTDTATQVSVRDARRYDGNAKVGDKLTQGPMGVLIGLANPRIEGRSDPFWVAFPNSFRAMWSVLVTTRDGLAQGISSGTNPGVTGPIGIAQATGEVVEQQGVYWIFPLTALLSLSLAVINILPIPALDGGRLLFVIIEWVRRGKRISPKKEGLAHLIGFALLIGFILFVSYFDVLRLLRGESILQ